MKNLKKRNVENDDDNKNEFGEKQEDEEAKNIENKRSFLNVLPNILGGDFFNSEWSFAQVRITNQSSICCFGPDNTIIVVTTEGKYYKAQFDVKNGGDCKIIKEEDLII